jgi:hypothetical protein
MRPRGASALLVLVLTAVACAPVASSRSATPSASVAPIPSPSLSPTLTVAPTATLTASPSRSPTTRTPAPVRSPVPSDLVVRIDQSSDVCCPYTSLLVAADGSYVIRDKVTTEYLTMRQLGPDGVRLVREHVASTGLFGGDAALTLIPRPGPTPLAHGIGATSVSFWNGTRAVRVSMTEIVSGEESYYDVSPQQIALTKLVSELRAPETWLPVSAWRDAAATPYAAKYYAVIQGPSTSGSSGPFDLGKVVWPFATPLTEFGDEVSPAGRQRLVGTAGWSFDGPVRCATVTREDAQAIQDALMNARAPIFRFSTWFGVNGTVGGQSISLVATALLPIFGSCTDQFWW